MKVLVFDLETNGLLDQLDTIHCMWIGDPATGERWDFGPGKIMDGLGVLATADVLAGHNIIGFDLPALHKVYGWKPKGGAIIRDTMVLTSLMWPHIKEHDFPMANKGLLPKQLIGRQSLEAWGYRLRILKGLYEGGWETWNQEMHDYCEQDVAVTTALWKRIEKEAEAWVVPLLDDNPPAKKDCIVLEHRVAAITEMVSRHGFKFNRGKAIELVGKLTARKQQLTEQLATVFPPRIVEEVIVPKANNSRYGYVKGQPFTKRWTVEFNPGSRQEVGRRLQDLGWKPAEFGKDGYPTIDDDILNTLPYPEAKVLAEWYTVDKRLGQIANGKEAWFRHERNGRIHGRIRSNGAHTGRMSHSNPNMAQVPKVGVPYGAECRDCFEADTDWDLVGCDADALELRDLAGYMSLYDGGAYIETVLKGDKANGTDMHSINAALIGCSRDVAKVFFYAMAYGSGDANLGAILGAHGRKAVATGRRARTALMEGVPALGSLVKAVQKAAEVRGYLVGLDGRRLVARAANAALNTLLQSAGAVQMKRGLVILFDDLIASGLKWGSDFAIVGLIHDEWQITCRPELADQVGGAAVKAIEKAGAFYKFGCPLTGQYQKGASWRDTH